MPVPLKETVCGLPGALSVRAMEPERVPAAVGVNVTVMMQLAPTPWPEPQVFVWAKSPLATMLLIVRARLPVLVKVTVCGALAVPTGWFPKLRIVLERDKSAPATPLPDRAIVTVGAVLVMETVPVTAPAAVGANTTLNITLCPGVSVCAFKVVLNPAPVTLGAFTATFTFPVFVSVAV